VISSWDKKLAKLGVSRTVYSLLVPETAAVLDQLWVKRPHGLYAHAHTDRQDGYESKFSAKWIQWSAPVLSMPAGLTAHFYPTAGSSEAIRDSIASHAVSRPHAAYTPAIHVFYGDYEGYSAYATAFKVKVVRHDRNNYMDTVAIESRPGDLFYLSHPSSIDGNIWEGFDSFCSWIKRNAPGVKIMVDLCYVGMISRRYHINLNHSNISAVFLSLSKVFGVYYHRIGGMFSRDERPSLCGNMWFKNMFSLQYGIDLMNAHGVYSLPRTYKNYQLSVVSELSPVFRRLHPSDVTMLAYQQPAPGDNKFEKYFTREKGITRVCLTPKMDRMINPK
jgi:histidinol-phosphate/aromatic aminotransferase/cobyric acid decarboxylase-like protein